MREFQKGRGSNTRQPGNSLPDPSWRTRVCFYDLRRNAFHDKIDISRRDVRFHCFSRSRSAHHMLPIIRLNFSQLSFSASNAAENFRFHPVPITCLRRACRADFSPARSFQLTKRYVRCSVVNDLIFSPRSPLLLTLNNISAPASRSVGKSLNQHHRVREHSRLSACVCAFRNRDSASERRSSRFGPTDRLTGWLAG